VRRRDLDPRDVCRRDGMSALAARLAALEVAALLPRGGAILDHALRRKIRWPDLLAAYRRAMGTNGSGRMRELVVAAADRADSQAERILFRLLREAGVTGWTRAVRFGDWELDVAFEKVRLFLEIDGWAWHVDHDRFVEDRLKQNALVAAGWTPLRFTWHDLIDDPNDVVAEVRRALLRAAS
jgi:very-short-patch-repair endonuclease